MRSSLRAVQQRGVALMNVVHERILGTTMSGEMLSFVKGIGFLGAGNIISSALLIPVQIASIRILGPDEVGKYALVLSMSDFLVYFMLMGLHASIEKHLPERYGNEEGQRAIVATCMGGIAVFSCIAAALYALLRIPMMHYLGIPTGITITTLWFSCFLALKLVAEAVLRGRLQFQRQATLDVLSSIAVFVAFFSMFFLGAEHRFLLYVRAVWVGVLVYTTVAVSRNWRLFRLRHVDRALLKSFLAYGLYSILGSVGLFVAWNSDRFFLNKFHGINDVGIYAVYYGASLMVLGRATSVVMRVLLPMASRHESRSSMNEKITTLMRWGAIPLVGLNMLFVWGMLWAYGARYPIRIGWIMLFALNAVLYAFINARGALLAADGVRGMRSYARHALGMAAIAGMLNMALIPRFGISGGIAAATTVSLCFLGFLSSHARHFFERVPAVAPM